jgi:hypothetical protein
VTDNGYEEPETHGHFSAPNPWPDPLDGTGFYNTRLFAIYATYTATSGDEVIAADTGALEISGTATFAIERGFTADTAALEAAGTATFGIARLLSADTATLEASGTAVLSLEPTLYPFVTRKGFYGMRQIKFNTASVDLRFEYPLEWASADITDLTLTIKNRLGTNIRSGESLTLYTATTLGADAARFASSITLASGAGALTQGDPIRIAGVEGAEIVRVKGYNSTTRVVELESILENAHDSGDAVTGRFGDITIDTTDTDVFPAGLVMTLVWAPFGTGKTTTESAQIAVSALDVEGLDRRFARLYPRAYDAFTKPVYRLADMLDEAERQVRLELRSNNIEYERIIDQDIIAPAIMAKMAWLWALNGDIAKQDERDAIGQEYSKQFALVLRMPIWTDFDQDFSQDSDTDGETTSHEHIFEGGW